MSKKSIAKLPYTLSEYLGLKAKEYEISERELSQLIIPGSSGSLIATIRFDERKLSEKKINKIAEFFKDDTLLLTFMAGRIPKVIYYMIINDTNLQECLIDILIGKMRINKTKNGKFKMYIKDK